MSSPNVPAKPTPEEVMARHFEVPTCERCGYGKEGCASSHNFRQGHSVCGYCEPSEPWPCDAWTRAERLKRLREVLL